MSHPDLWLPDPWEQHDRLRAEQAAERERIMAENGQREVQELLAGVLAGEPGRPWTPGHGTSGIELITLP